MYELNWLNKLYWAPVWLPLAFTFAFSYPAIFFNKDNFFPSKWKAIY